MSLLHNHLTDSCSYVRKNTLRATKGGCICTPLTPPKSATAHPMPSGCYAGFSGLELQALLAPVVSPSIAQCSLHTHIKGAAVYCQRVAWL